MITTLFQNNGYLITVSNLEDNNGNIISNASLGATMYEADEVTEVTGPTWPVSLIATTEAGSYETSLPSNAALTLGNEYVVKVSGTANGVPFERWLRVRISRGYS